ncbi:Imm1 family immunity protein [Asanoa sp. WMMD1127]|uniref:Imm1 family immunity protein n=1 Tax=Asanoa sp. WMMD1127 TaxID=3016107 RepID=UPI002417536F|nr:Imm1 family immunity protein [Asanoa sp. WMMD1127]MDG4826223.1 Imm1 family immunity protein [Asanoa sp. WMMD1127]
MRLERDRWRGGEAERFHDDEPGPAAVEAAVRALDQRQHTEVVVTGHDGQYLAIEGGAGRYTVHLGSDEHDDVIVVCAPDAPVGDALLVAAGRVRRVPRRRIVDLDTVLCALRTFLADGHPDGTLCWESG